MGEEKITQEEVASIKYPYVVSIRFKRTKKAYSFGSNDNNFKIGEFVIVETIRGLELGQVIHDSHPIEEHAQNFQLKPIVRKATKNDIAESERNLELAKESLSKCGKAIEDLKLDMRLIEAEYTLDRSKVIFTYVADERVDFRELLKELTTLFKCRIELRQIGPRDKAKLVGGLGSCGRETCCSRFLNDFDVVSINMAKNQMIALNIQKLSGQCGKLMCCLKYEDSIYKALKEGLPKLNSQIEYEKQIFKITNLNVITKTAKIENREHTLFISFDDLSAKGKVIQKQNPNTKAEGNN